MATEDLVKWQMEQIWKEHDCRCPCHLVQWSRSDKETTKGDKVLRYHQCGGLFFRKGKGPRRR